MKGKSIAFFRKFSDYEWLIGPFTSTVFFFNITKKLQTFGSAPNENGFRCCVCHTKCLVKQTWLMISPDEGTLVTVLSLLCSLKEKQPCGRWRKPPQSNLKKTFSKKHNVKNFFFIKRVQRWQHWCFTKQGSAVSLARSNFVLQNDLEFNGTFALRHRGVR